MAKNTDKSIPVKLSSSVDVSTAASVYRKLGRVHMPDILSSQSVKQLVESLSQDIPWKLHFNSSGNVYDLEPAQFEALPDSGKKSLTDAIHANARSNFQYLFENFPVSDMYESGYFKQHYVMRVYEFLNSKRFLSFARELTGNADIRLVDAQLTRYQPGHFLTCHDDHVPGKNRVAAYVLGLTDNWRPDWGGALNFVDGDGHIAEGYMPRLNALNVFKVPQLHSVGCVAPFAGSPRISVSGWFRT